jgi:DNA-binding transcriptional LysR family regulator
MDTHASLPSEAAQLDATHAGMQPPLEDLRWDDLRVLLAVLRAGSFSAAAATLEVEQSTVSRRVAALELALGATLFDRLRTGPRPTELAVALRARLERVEADVHAVLDGVRARDPDVRGRVRLALTESMAVHVVIPRLMGPLRAKHPHLELDLLTSDLAADLGRREADIALRFFRPTDGDLVAKRVAQLRTAVLAHRSYPGIGRAREALDVIALELPGIPSREEAFLAEHVRVKPVMRTNGYLAQVEAVRAGLGVALLARSLLALDTNLVALDLGLPEGPSLDVWLVCPKSLRDVPRVDAVWRALEDALPALEDVG